jgi:cell division transport system permease protein
MFKNYLFNIKYFLKEARTIFKVDLLSNIFSILSISFILLILVMIISGLWVSTELVLTLEKEAEINVYYKDDLELEEINKLSKNISSLDGVTATGIISEDESFSRMEDILGKEAKVLEYFQDNPFSSFIEVKIDILKLDYVLDSLNDIEEVQSIRDNREVLDRLSEITVLLKFLSLVFITAIGISTIVVISHIIRQGIYNNRDMINTLKLLGAPNSFIGLPFLLEGLLLTLFGGLLAGVLSNLVINYVYSQMLGSLPFIPLPDRAILIWSLNILILVLSAALGVIGSIFGLRSAKSN